MKNSFGQKKFVNFTWDGGEPGRFLGTSKAYFSLFFNL
jgi:sulfatase maturation enzyme AslB (radical SAM superfamily)